MRIWWCQEHEAPIWFSDTTICSFAKYGPGYDPAPCRMIPMRLIPDNEETLNQRIAEVLDAWAPDLNDAAVALFTDEILNALGIPLDGETP